MHQLIAMTGQYHIIIIYQDLEKDTGCCLKYLQRFIVLFWPTFLEHQQIPFPCFIISYEVNENVNVK